MGRGRGGAGESARKARDRVRCCAAPGTSPRFTHERRQQQICCRRGTAVDRSAILAIVGPRVRIRTRTTLCVLPPRDGLRHGLGVLDRRYLARRGSHARRASRHRRDQWRATGCLSGTHLACAQRDARGGTARVRGTVGFGDDAAAARLVTRGEGEKG